MGNFKYKARTMQPQGKPKVYFCCHPADFDKYYDIISNTIISIFDCSIYYCDNSQQEDGFFLTDLSQMNVFVVPVTTKMLCTPNRAMDNEIPYALESHIPIIPIILESGLDEIVFYKLHDIVCINWHADDGINYLAEQLKKTLDPVLLPRVSEGSWIFLSHSSADIEKVRVIRNEFEKMRQNPLAFHLKCLKTDTVEEREELESLIKREIDSRDWFVFCESDAARKSQYVNMEKEYIIKSGKKKIWTIDMSLPIEDIILKVHEICTQLKIYISYRKRNKNYIRLLYNELLTYDFDVFYDEFLIPGEHFDERMKKELDEASSYGFVVAIISEGDEMSYTVQYELPIAIAKGARIIVISIGDVNVIETYFDASKVKHYNLPNMPTVEDIGLIAKLIEAETRRQIKGPICQADAYNVIAKIEEQLNYKHKYHSQDAILDHVTGSSDDYLEIYKFPCCGKTVVVGDGPVSRFRADGCCCDN